MYYPAMMIAPGTFLRVTGGALFLDHTNVRTSGTIGGVPATASGSASFKTGYIASGILGYQADPYLALELEGGYSKFDIKNGSATVALANGGATTGTISGSGNAIFGLVNIVISPLGAKSPFSPYLGGGGGVWALHGSGTVGGLALGTNGRTAQAMADAILGFNITITPNFQIGTRYRFIFVNSTRSRIDTVEGHSLSVTATFQF